LLFVLLFSRVSLSFAPPQVKRLSLSLITSGASQSDIIQTEAVWSVPENYEPEFPVAKALAALESQIDDSMRLGQLQVSAFLQPETLMPSIDIRKTAEKLRPQPPNDFFSPLPAESKAMPTAEFALGADFPEIIEK
jgi:hypothetical protein